MSISYKLHFEEGLVASLEDVACFSFLHNYYKSMKYSYGIKEGGVKLSSIEYGIRMEQNVETMYFINYLYNKYSPYIQEDDAHSIYQSKTVTVLATTPANQALFILNFFRFMHEFKAKIPRFYEMRGCANQDLAFLIACGVNEGNSNHNPIGNMTIEKVYNFVKDDYSEDAKGRPLNVNPEYRELTDNFSYGGGKRVLSDIQAAEHRDYIKTYEALEKVYEKYSSAMAVKLQEALPERGNEGGDDLQHEGADWAKIIFA